MTLEQEFDAAVRHVKRLAERIEGSDAQEHILYEEHRPGSQEAKRYALAVSFPLPMKSKEA